MVGEVVAVGQGYWETYDSCQLFNLSWREKLRDPGKSEPVWLEVFTFKMMTAYYERC